MAPDAIGAFRTAASRAARRPDLLAYLSRNRHEIRVVELRPSWKRKLAGWSLVIFGVVGIILPFLHGMIFLLLGVFMMREQYLWAHNALGPLQRRFPGMMLRMNGMEAKVIAWGRRQLARLPSRA